MTGNALGLEVADQWIKASIPRHDVEGRARILGYQSANVVRDMEVESVATASLNLDVLCIRPKGLHRLSYRDGNLSLVATQKHLDPDRPSAQSSQVLGLYVLEVDEHKFWFQALASPGTD